MIWYIFLKEVEIFFLIYYNKNVIKFLSGLGGVKKLETTESRNKKTYNLDRLSIGETIEMMNDTDKEVIDSIKNETASIEQVITNVVKCLKNNGRLFYIGAGTSGRLGVLDAAECVPTFGTDPELIQGIIAGGQDAMLVAVEGAEDSEELGKLDLISKQLTENDFVLGIAASGRTPYVIGAYADNAIEVQTGAEVLTGSTRLKAGTAQKLVLNMISTISMIQLGKVYENLMVDVQPTNLKLVQRAKHIIMEATGCTYEVAQEYFETSNRSPKLAIVRILTKTSKEEAIIMLEKNNDNIRKVLSNI